MNGRTSVVLLCNNLKETLWEEGMGRIRTLLHVPLCSHPLWLWFFFLYSIACVLCVLFDLSRFFYYRIAGPISQRCVLKLTVILTTNQAFQTAGSVNNRWSKAVPPWGTLHFPELSHCVFSLTALFALRLSHKRESEPPVAVITAPLK